jgi:hypothetical protein
LAPKQFVLKQRWDNARHYPDLPNFPHHVHVNTEDHILPGKSRNILEILELIEQELENLKGP